MNENDDHDSAISGRQASSKPKPSWRSLDWWLGRTTEHEATIKEYEAAANSLTPGARALVIIVCLAAMAGIIAACGWLVTLPLVGIIILLAGVRLITGKWPVHPVPAWAHLLFWAMIITTAVLMAAQD